MEMQNSNMDIYTCKAKTLYDGEWITGYYLQGKDYLYDKPMHFIFRASEVKAFPRSEFTDAHEIDPSTLCRCTGAVDKHGNLIFEHDILHGTVYHMFDAINETFEVHWLDDVGGCGLNYFEPSDCEIIGNKFDNTNLMED